jgi:hypothetical protein
MRKMVMSRVVLAAATAGLVLAALPTYAGGPYQYHSLTPCRLADTRNATGASGGPKLLGQQTRTFPVQGLCNVPVGAVAVSVNVTAVGPNGAGFLTLFPTGGSLPVVSTVNFVAGEPALANGAIVPLGTYSATAPFDRSIYSRIVGPGAGESGGYMDMVLDVTGYFQ